MRQHFDLIYLAGPRLLLRAGSRGRDVALHERDRPAAAGKITVRMKTLATIELELRGPIADGGRQRVAR